MRTCIPYAESVYVAKKNKIKSYVDLVLYGIKKVCSVNVDPT